MPSEQGKLERRERLPFLFQQTNELGVPHQIVGRVACDAAPPLLSKLPLDDGEELFPALQSSIAKFAGPQR